MALYTYESLLNDNVQFLQGSQADLNKFLPTASSTEPNRGRAQEGAFYLTTDTHRLYIGRKVTTGEDQGKVFPEEVSTGIATVVDTGELSDAQKGGAAHDGDFYYIKDSNVLAVYKEGTNGGDWVQINSPTGIASFGISIGSEGPGTTPTFSDNSTYVKIHSSIRPDGSSNDTAADFWLKAGDNVTLKPSNDNQTVEISSANSQSELKVSDNSVSADTNNAPIILTDGINDDTSVHFIGAQDTTVESKINNGENQVIITGPGIQGTKITALGEANATSGDLHGFNVAVSVKQGNTSTVNDKLDNSANHYSKLDPSITVGKTSSSTRYFYGGNAKLDVYTTTEVDQKISSEITSALQTADALHYKGTVDSSNAIASLTNVKVGDVYKASADFTHDSNTIKTGDLLIAQGTEDTNGNITSATLTWEIIPSGDEPLLVGEALATTNSNPYFGLSDSHISGDYASQGSAAAKAAKRPLHVEFDNANSVLIKAESEGSADNFKVKLKHTVPSNGNVTTLTASNSMIGTTGTDSLGGTPNNKITFQALQSITRDDYGHVTAVTGKQIVLSHNYLTKLSATHSATNNVGTIVLGAEDNLGITQATNILTKGNIKIGSNTLAINADSNNTQLNVDLVWKNF